MDETFKRQDLAAFPASTEGNGAQKESPEEESSSAATPIKVDPRRNPRCSRKVERAHLARRLIRLADEFTSGMTPGADEAAQQPEPTEEEIRAMQTQQLSSMVDELTSNGLVRLILKKHLAYIDRLEERGKQSKEHLNDWARNMYVLISVAAVLQKNESVQKLFDAQVQTRCPIPDPQLSDEEQRIAKLTKVDQNLIREAGEKLKIFLKHSIEDGAESGC